ncbi:hypothetical protein FCV24_14125 [Clostridium botulinum]|uniref:hypothetical protein n=1 Tax=Clostridium botulinum TaxID=1491 RepID=UPI0005F94A9A|nr:hypothetical protein [Clostridium botulinum]MBY6799523.1 hypothetical protein [Clostridium botulinum]NFF20874.1 hypothetical protein [Clostridium botulinum]NFM75516.1 hypothetical protein [Clostridium botulinum]NFP81067.1 hypothetical protein [Clostridium botulinum]NFP94040.1 hypothetical protein [Clostridium botulinum]
MKIWDILKEENVNKYYKIIDNHTFRKYLNGCIVKVDKSLHGFMGLFNDSGLAIQILTTNLLYLDFEEVENENNVYK